MKSVRFPIGLQFTLSRGKKDSKIHTVTDILKTYSSKGDLVEVEYVTEFNYIGGQKVTFKCFDVTIAKALDKEDRLNQFL
jgi:hypothetical protein